MANVPMSLGQLKDATHFSIYVTPMLHAIHVLTEAGEGFVFHWSIYYPTEQFLGENTMDVLVYTETWGCNLLYVRQN